MHSALAYPQKWYTYRVQTNLWEMRNPDSRKRHRLSATDRLVREPSLPSPSKGSWESRAPLWFTACGLHLTRPITQRLAGRSPSFRFLLGSTSCSPTITSTIIFDRTKAATQLQRRPHVSVITEMAQVGNESDHRVPTSWSRDDPVRMLKIPLSPMSSGNRATQISV